MARQAIPGPSAKRGLPRFDPDRVDRTDTSSANERGRPAEPATRLVLVTAPS
jgi:hypothetical protein